MPGWLACRQQFSRVRTRFLLEVSWIKQLPWLLQLYQVDRSYYNLRPQVRRRREIKKRRKRKRKKRGRRGEKRKNLLRGREGSRSSWTCCPLCRTATSTSVWPSCSPESHPSTCTSGRYPRWLRSLPDSPTRCCCSSDVSDSECRPADGPRCGWSRPRPRWTSPDTCTPCTCHLHQG